MKRTFLWLGVAAIGIGIAVLAYRGPGQPIVRGHVGDVAATMLVYAMLGMLFARVRMAWRAAATIAIATAIEVGQAFWHATSAAGELLVGNTWDPWDIFAYVAGVIVATGWERFARRATMRASCVPRF